MGILVTGLDMWVLVMMMMMMMTMIRLLQVGGEERGSERCDTGGGEDQRDVPRQVLLRRG